MPLSTPFLSPTRQLLATQQTPSILARRLACWRIRPTSWASSRRRAAVRPLGARLMTRLSRQDSRLFFFCFFFRRMGWGLTIAFIHNGQQDGRTVREGEGKGERERKRTRQEQ